MLKHLQKYFTGSPVPQAVQAAITEEVEMTETTEANAQAAAVTIAELTASLEQANTALANKESAFAELSNKVDTMTKQLSDLETEKVSLADKAKAVIQATRKEKLEVVLGTIGAAPVLASLEGADDSTFETVLAAFSANREAEGQSKMFKEEGVAAEVKTPVEEADTATRLAAKFAAQYNPEGK